jgi:L-ascorbate metabolism protein UlaG (beta-lactamase superfamily)
MYYCEEMKIHHLRNATMLLETATHNILIDPMLSQKGQAAPPFSFIRFKPRRNPTVDLPQNGHSVVAKTTHCVVTHLHPDHLDTAGEGFLKSKQIPVICSVTDVSELKKRGLAVVKSINYWEERDFFGGKITGIPAQHGYGAVAKRMGKVMGYYIELPDQPSVYLSSDTIYTDEVHKVLTNLQPDIAVVACGSAQLDLYKPILMHKEDILKFFDNAPGQVIANHLEALNHCPTKRVDLINAVAKLELFDKVWIPDDGDSRIYN